MDLLKKISGSVYAALLFALLAAWLTAPAPELFKTSAGPYYYTGNFSDYIDRGKTLIYGVKDEGATFSMPLMSAVSAVFLSDSSKSGMNRLVFWLHFGIYFLCFILGKNAAGPAGGFLAALSALAANLALKNNFEAEQLLFSLFVMLALNMLAYRQRKPDLLRNSLLGLAIGCALLVRSDLFLLPFAVLVWDRLRLKTAAAPAPFKKTVLNAAALLAFSYALLVPWLGVNYFLQRKAVLFESERGTCDIITGAMGSVYTMEGDCRKLAGLSPQDSVMGWAARRVLAAPLAYSVSVLKRLLHIFYIYPFLFLFAAAGCFFCRRDTAGPAAMLAVYFVLLHSLVSIEARYFYPLRYVLSFLGAQVICRWAEDGAERRSPLLLCVFGAALLPVLLLEAVLVSYPLRAKSELAALEAASVSSSDPWLREKKGEYLFKHGQTREGLDSFSRAYENSGRKDLRLAYILSVLGARSSAVVAPPDAASGLDTPDSWVLKALKETEFRDMDKARVSLLKAYELWNGRGNLLRGIPYGTDEEILFKIQETNSVFWNYHIYNCLFYWPPGNRRVLVERLSRITRLTPELQKLAEGPEVPPGSGNN